MCVLVEKVNSGMSSPAPDSQVQDRFQVDVSWLIGVIRGFGSAFWIRQSKVRQSFLNTHSAYETETNVRCLLNASF